MWSGDLVRLAEGHGGWRQIIESSVGESRGDYMAVFLNRKFWQKHLQKWEANKDCIGCFRNLKVLFAEFCNYSCSLTAGRCKA